MKILREFITLTGLCDRWQCDIDLIAPYTQRRLNKRGFPDIDPILQAYRAVSARVCSMGMAQACDAKEIGAIAKEDFVPDWRGETLYNRGEVVFDMDQVRALERAEPTLLCTAVPYATTVATTPQGYEPEPTPPKAYEPEPQYAQPAPSQPGPEELDQVKAQLAQVSAERDKLQGENNSLRRELDTAKEALAQVKGQLQEALHGQEDQKMQKARKSAGGVYAGDD